MQRIAFLVVPLLFGASLFAWVFNAVGFAEIKNSFSLFTLWKFSVIIFLAFLMSAVGIWKWMVVLKGMGVKIGYKSLIPPYLMGYAVMFLAPIIIWGGEILRSYIIKERNAVAWKHGMASVIVDRMFEWTANLVVIIFGTSIFITKIYKLPGRTEVFFGLFFLFFTAVMFYFYSRVFKKQSFIKIFIRIFGFRKIKIKEDSIFLEIENEIFAFFHPKNKEMWYAIAGNFARIVIMWFRAWILIFFLGGAINAFLAFSILGFNYLALSVPIPAALGSNEAIQTFAFEALGLARSGATVFASVIRVSEITVALIGVAVLFRFGTKFLGKIFFRKITPIDIENINV